MKKINIWYVIGILLVALVLFLSVIWFWNYCTVQWFKAEVVQAESVHESDMKLFFERSIEPIISKLDHGTYPLEEVQKKYTSLSLDLIKKYDGRKIERKVSPTYYKNRSDVYSFSYVSNDGDPNWGLIVPALMDKIVQIDGNTAEEISESYELFVIVHALHEMSKLVHLADIQEQTAENEFLIESFIWADICDEVLCPIVEVHGVVLDDQTFNWHFGWVYSGKETNDDWRTFVREQFAPLQSD